jgi:hypothetical protein
MKTEKMAQKKPLSSKAQEWFFTPRQRGEDSQKKEVAQPYQRRTGYPAWGLLQEETLKRCSMALK